MATAAVLARGTQIFREDTPASGTFTTLLPECKNIQWPNPSSTEVDVTNQDSAGRAKEFLIGEQDFGECIADCNYIPGNAVQQQLITDRDADPPTSRLYRIKRPDGTWQTEFTAYVSGFDRTADPTRELQGNLRLRVTGLPTELP